MSEKDLRDIIQQINDVIKFSSKYEKDSIKKDIKELQEAWKKGSKSDVLACAMEIKKKIEDKHGSYYMDLTKKLQALHKKIPDSRQPSRPKSAQSVKLHMDGEKAKVHPRTKNPKDTSENPKFLKELFEIRNILSNDLVAESDDIQKMLTDIRFLTKRVIEENKNYQLESQTQQRKIHDKLSSLKKVFGDGSTTKPVPEQSWDGVCAELEQIEKRVYDEVKSIGIVITGIEKEVKNLEKIRKLTPGNDIGQGETNATKLKEIHSRLMSLKKAEEAASAKSPKQNDELQKKLKQLEERVKTVWTSLVKNKISSNDTAQSDNSKSSDRMLSEIENKVCADIKSLSSFITDIDKEVKKMEQLRKQDRGKDIGQGETTSDQLKQLHSRLLNLRNVEEAASSKIRKQNDDIQQRMKQLEEKVKTVWTTVVKTVVSSEDMAETDKNTNLDRMLSDIEKRVSGDMKSLNSLINELDKEVKSLEQFRKQPPGKNIGQGETNASKLKQIHSRLMYLKNAEEAASKKKVKQKDETGDKLKLIEDRVKKIWSDFCSKGVSSDVTDSERMLSDIVKAQKQIKDEFAEQIEQTKESTQLLKKSVESIQTLLLNKPFKFEEPECYRERNIKDFNELHKIQLLLVHRIEDLVVQNAERFQTQFVAVERYESLKAERKELMVSVDKLKVERDQVLNRLSKIAGAKLTDNNPNIADLSDPNRPTRLAEQYSELYDNVWTDAYESLKLDDKACLNFLLKILIDCYEICGGISVNHQMILKRVLCNPTEDIGFAHKATKQKDKERSSTISVVQSKALSDLRKQSANLSVISVKASIQKEHKEWFKTKELETYTFLSIELCWLMHVQSPPLFLDTSVKSGSPFETSRYKQYTKAGKNIDYLVWPALLLHEGGAMLCKGVAQGK